MTTETNIETSAHEIAAAAPTSKTTILKLEDDKVIVQDVRGRVIVVQKLTALAYYKLSKAMGENSANEAASGLALLAASVRKIDTNHFPMPTRDRDIELVIQSLDFDGLEAVTEGLKHLNVSPEVEIEAAKN